MKKRYLLLGLCLLGLGLAKQPAMAAVDQETTQTNPVAVDSTMTLASCAKYKDMDYSPLKTFDYGSTVKYDKAVDTMEDLLKIEPSNLKKGMRVKTSGYYMKGDGGAGVYVISDKKGTGGKKLTEELYVNLQPDTYKSSDKTVFALVSVKQLGAKADGVAEDHTAINDAIKLAGDVANGSESYDRGLAYIPTGQYKCGDAISIGARSTNVVGDGDNSILFTDNDYRDEEGYSEFFCTVWGAIDTYIGDFRIEAREVDLHKYMRQLVYVYSQDVYTYNVDTIVPQGAYSSYYFEDKQYSNYCVYCGNKNITIDGSKMVQLSGTYRGANLGILDIWAAGEQNITIMNCDMYGNARDEQVGFFSKSDPNASVKHVNFINNTMHSTQIKYPEIIGTRTMCFTVAYANSQNIDDIRIAGNHFICETDSKFMTFGTMTNCVVENNIIEIKCTYKTWSMVFDSSNGDCNNILVRNNEFYLTSDEGHGKGNIVGGKLTLTGNRIFSDVRLPYGVVAPECHNNEIIYLATMGILACNSNCTGNKVELYNGLESQGTNCKQIGVYGGNNGSADAEYIFSNNEIYDYLRYDKKRIFRSLIKLDGDLKKLTMDGNGFYFPNARYLTSEFSADKVYEDKLGKYFLNDIYRKRSGTYGSVITTNNKFQAIQIPESDDVFTFKNNKQIDMGTDLSEELATKVKIMYQGKEVDKITTSDASIDLDEVVYIAETKDEAGKVLTEKKVSGKKLKWYSSVNQMASVDKNGLVKRKMYGEVHIYAVPLDGSGTFAECEVHFSKKKAESISVTQKEISVQPELKEYVEYKVLPATASQDLNWTSKDESIAKVNYNGMVLGVAPGNTTITATTTDGSGVSVTLPVVVSEVTVKKINLNKAFLKFDQNQIGQSAQVEVAGYVPDNATNKGIGKWESDNPKAVTVDANGKVTAVGGGFATVSAYSKDLKCKGTISVFVQPDKVENLKAEEVTDTSVKVTWDANPNCYGYYVYQWNANTSKWDMLNNNNYLTDTQFSLKNLTNNTTYKFCVRSFLSNWLTGERVVYESLDSVIEIKTMSTSDIFKVKGGDNPLGVCKEDKATQLFSYEHKDADVSQFSIEIENENIASIAEKKLESGKITLSIAGNNYGETNLILKTKPTGGIEKVVPVGCMTKKMLKSEYLKVESVGQYIDVNFSNIDEQDKLINEGGMNGYGVVKHRGAATVSAEFIPAEIGKTQYSYTDTTVSPGQSFDYSVCPALKVGEHVYYGYGCTRQRGTATILKKVQKITPDKSVYTVEIGKKTTIPVQISPADAEVPSLSWETDNKDIANAYYISGNQPIIGMQYGEVYGAKLGSITVTMSTTDGTDIKKTVKAVVVPKLVEGVTTISNGEGVKLQWTKMDDVDGYSIYRRTPSQKKWSLVKTSTKPQCQDTTAKTGTVYIYKVCAYIKVDKKRYDGSPSAEVIGISGSNDGSFAGVTVKGYDGVYDQKFHNTLFVKGVKKTDKLTYSPDGLSWSYNIPVAREVKESKMVYACVKRGKKQYVYGVFARIREKSDKSLMQGKEYIVGKLKYAYYGDNTVAVTGVTKKNLTSISVPATVKIKTVKCKVTTIGARTFKGLGKLKTVTIGANVKVIGTSAFENDKNLVKITLKTSKLTKVGTNVVKNTSKKLKFRGKKNVVKMIGK